MVEYVGREKVGKWGYWTFGSLSLESWVHCFIKNVENTWNKRMFKRFYAIDKPYLKISSLELSFLIKIFWNFLETKSKVYMFKLVGFNK